MDKVKMTALMQQSSFFRYSQSISPKCGALKVAMWLIVWPGRCKLCVYQV